MATKRIKDLTATATQKDLISENYGVLDTSGITKKVPGYLLGGGSGTTYSAGYGIDLTNDTISVNTDIIATKESVDTLSNAIGKWEDISSEFTPTSVITYINRKIIRINRSIGLVYFNIDINGNFYRTTDTIRQILFTKSSKISNLEFTASYGVFMNTSTLKFEMPYQLDCRNHEIYNGIIGWLPDAGYRASFVLVSGIVPFSLS